MSGSPGDRGMVTPISEGGPGLSVRFKITLTIMRPLLSELKLELDITNRNEFHQRLLIAFFASHPQ